MKASSISPPPYRDPLVCRPDRVRDLLKRMTVEEKIMQTIILPGWKGKGWRKAEDNTVHLEDEVANQLRQGLGALLAVTRATPWSGIRSVKEGLCPQKSAELVNRMQCLAVEESRLGIPFLNINECPHGHVAIGCTTFPVSLSMGCSWNPGLIERVFRAVGSESYAMGTHVALAPIVDIARDPRWSRCEETFGEDAFLTSNYVSRAVRALQEKAPDHPHLTASCIKHIAAYGIGEGGHNSAPVSMDPKEFIEVFMETIRAACDAGLMSGMSSYNTFNGEPVATSHWILTELLRDRYGFNGYIMSDFGGHLGLVRDKGTSVDAAESLCQMLAAGGDQKMAPALELDEVLEGMSRGLLTEEQLDLNVGRILDVKFRLGLFERPYISTGLAPEICGASSHRELALEAACESIVLLKNSDHLLPLDPETTRHLALIGPNADSPYNQTGDYTSPQHEQRIVTVRQGLEQAADWTVHYAPGGQVRSATDAELESAEETAREADVAIVVLGTSSNRYQTKQTALTGAAMVDDCSDMDCGEGVDCATLDLGGRQIELVQRVVATGTPTVVVLVHGRPQNISAIEPGVSAIVEAFYPGEQGGVALAQILIGAANPSGKLNISIPRHAGQLPVYYNGKPETRKKVVDLPDGPLYPFGHGLSYTTFAYTDLEIDAADFPSTGEARVRVTVENTGNRSGREVAQLYIRDCCASLLRPVRELKGFEKIELAPGARLTVHWTLTRETLSFVHADLQWRFEPGEFEIFVGGSSATSMSRRIRLDNASANVDIR